MDTGGRREALAVDAILVGAGRTPNVEGLGLEAAGVAYDAAAGVRVDDRLRTTNPRIFAAGDVCSAHKFTHAADFQARARPPERALPRPRPAPAPSSIPRCTYTDPEVAQWASTSARRRARDFAVDTFVQPLAEVDRAVLDGETEGFVKVHVRARERPDRRRHHRGPARGRDAAAS